MKIDITIFIFILALFSLTVNSDAILEKIKEAGFRIALQKELTLTKEQAEEFYHEHAGQPYFDELTIRMSRYSLLFLGVYLFCCLASPCFFFLFVCVCIYVCVGVGVVWCGDASL